MIWVLLRFEIKNLWMHKGFRTALLLLSIAGLYALYYGHSEINHQKSIIAQFPQMQQAIDESYLQSRFGKQENAGRLAYYLNQTVCHLPNQWANLSLGIRDLHPYCQGIRLLGLHSQLYDSGFNNPTHSLAGNFDLSFVLIILVPLWIISLVYNLISSEEELGTWRLLASSATPVTQLLALKLYVRWFFVIAICLGIQLAAMLYNSLAWDVSALAWAAITVAYVTFWFAVCSAVVALRSNSSFNASVLLALWLLLCIVAPATMNLATQSLLPVPYGFEISMQQRQTTHGGWDKPKAETFEKVKTKHPKEWGSVKPELEKYSWTWYYAMHQVGDDSVSELAASYFQTLEKRQQWAESFAYLSPPVLAQLLYDRVACSDLSTQLRYLDFVTQTHQQLKDRFYPLVFADKELTPPEYQEFRRSFPVSAFQPQLEAAKIWPLCGGLLAWGVAVAFIVPVLYRRSSLQK